MELIFRNTLVEAKSIPLLTTGQGLSVGPVRLSEKRKDGSEFRYEEEPEESALTKHFTAHIQRVKINNRMANTNILILDCDQWPEQVSFSADIVVDLSKDPEIKKNQIRLGLTKGYIFIRLGTGSFQKQ